MRIKKFLRKFLPAPAETLEMGFTDIHSHISDLENRIRIMEMNQKNFENLLYDHLDPALFSHVIKRWYQNNTGNILNLEDPKTYNEKIQWMKVFDRDPRKTMLSDKYLVRDWVKDKIGEEYLIPLLAVYRRAEEIDFERLPRSFVLKANHGCGMNYIVRDKTHENFEMIRQRARDWLETNYAYQFGYELQYNDINRKLIVEQYLENIDGDLPDYKFWCFDGKCKFIELIIGRGSEEGPRFGFYNTFWDLQPFSTGTYPKLKHSVEKPDSLEKMIEIAETLSEGFPHVRVDLYLLDNGIIKFGEMTFTTSSGVCRWDPPEADLLIGNLINLPKIS